MRPIKRSLTIAGHRTSISLEPPFWQALREVAAAENLTVTALVARLDAQASDTGEADGEAGGLSSRLRIHVLDFYRRRR